MKLGVLSTIAVVATMFSSCEKSSTGPENTAPVLSSIEDQTVTAGQIKDIVISAIDADGNSLTFSIPTNPGFLSITGYSQVADTATATLVIAPNETITGTFDATIQVSDGEGQVDSESFKIEVVAGFSLSDIVGIWTGEAESFINSFTLNLTIDAEGNASGTGAEGDLEISSGEWNIDNEGKVTGNNVISIYSAGMLTVEWGHWSLQISQDKVTLYGEFSSTALGTMDVNLTKQ